MKNILIKSLFVLLAIIIIAILWNLYTDIKRSPKEVSQEFLKEGFFTSLSEYITSGLGPQPTPTPKVTLEDLGELSPLSGMVTITSSSDSTVADDPHREYITIHAQSTNADPINISDWSLQSLITDTWISLPQGTELFVAGAVNTREDIYLAPGESAIIVSGASPVGVSFKINQCSGFLTDTQNFIPDIDTACTNPTELFEPTIENIQEYGGECATFLQNTRSCSYVTGSEPDFDSLSPACREYIQPRLTYNFCISENAQKDVFYAQKEWRLFLNQTTELWKESYEVIRLLDDQYRTIDVLTY